MRYCARRKGFSLVELLTVIAIVAILAAIVLGVGKRLAGQAQEKLARSTIGILVSALEQYYNYHGAFPFEAGIGYSEADFENDAVKTALGETITVTSGIPAPESWSSSALYYFLGRTPVSRQIIETLTDVMISNKDANGADLLIEIPTGDPPVDLIRFVDPWGNSLRYTYFSGNNFPVITSAGPDGDFLTSEDNIDSK